MFALSILQDFEGVKGMYSVVLMAALTMGSATPVWLHGGGCCGCFGGCSGYWGGCYGCYGGCFGYGCSGGGFGGCCGGCFGGGFGVGVGAPTYPDGIVPGDGFDGGFGDGVGAPTYPDGIVPGDGMLDPRTRVYPGGLGKPIGELMGTPTEVKGKGRDKKDEGILSATKAILIVELPANAKLFIDGMPVKVTAGAQSFHTPALEPGQLYYYMVRIEIIRDGQPISETRRIIVQAGQVARADFKELESEAVRTAQAR
jgi:uncharacterized protein (TIGR03000 family)